MFDTRTVGKKIAALRKEANKTQMELADEMGVSYQAVSNWERGNSMPDISKLPQLALILGSSIDEILGDSKEAELVEQVIGGNEKEYLKNQETEIETIAKIAPLMKPKQTKELVEIVIESSQGQEEGGESESSQEKKISAKELVILAPFLSEEYLEELVEAHGFFDNIKYLVPLAPYLSKETIEKIALNSKGDPKALVPLAPHLSRETLDKIALESEMDSKLLVPLAPHLSRETLDKIARKKDISVKKLAKLAPFLSEQTLDEFVERAIK